MQVGDEHCLCEVLVFVSRVFRVLCVNAPVSFFMTEIYFGGGSSSYRRKSTAPPRISTLLFNIRRMFVYTNVHSYTHAYTQLKSRTSTGGKTDKNIVNYLVNAQYRVIAHPTVYRVYHLVNAHPAHLDQGWREKNHLF